MNKNLRIFGGEGRNFRGILLCSRIVLSLFWLCFNEKKTS